MFLNCIFPIFLGDGPGNIAVKESKYSFPLFRIQREKRVVIFVVVFDLGLKYPRIAQMVIFTLLLMEIILIF